MSFRFGISSYVRTFVLDERETTARTDNESLVNLEKKKKRSAKINRCADICTYPSDDNDDDVITCARQSEIAYWARSSTSPRYDSVPSATSDVRQEYTTRQ